MARNKNRDRLIETFMSRNRPTSRTTSTTAGYRPVKQGTVAPFRPQKQGTVAPFKPAKRVRRPARY